MLRLLLLPPVLRGFIALAAGGISFPLAGVLTLRLNLLPLRYMLMHAVILAGTLALALSLPELPVFILVSVIAVLALLSLGRKGRNDLGVSASFLMILSIALAAVIAAKADVPSKDTLDLLWGSPYTITKPELIFLLSFSALLIAFIALCFPKLALLFFDRDTAQVTDRRVGVYEALAVTAAALSIVLAMRFTGALLTDALLILPVVAAMKRAGSLKGLFIWSSLIGFVSSTAGYLLSLCLDLPPSAAVSVVSVVIYLILPRRRKK